MTQLDTLLGQWQEAHAAACSQVDRQRMLGFPPAALPSRAALLYASLVALGARNKLEGLIRPDMANLRSKGVLDPNSGLADLNAGVLAAIEAIRPHLRSVLDLADAMAVRAFAAAQARSNEAAPVLDVPKKIRAAAGQRICVVINCTRADRVLIDAAALEQPFLIIQPASFLEANLTMFAGELIVYAENDFGCCKEVLQMEAGALAQSSRIDRRLFRASLGRMNEGVSS